MTKQTKKILASSLIAVGGGLFIWGITPASSYAWGWQWRHKPAEAKVSTTASANNFQSPLLYTSPEIDPAVTPTVTAVTSVNVKGKYIVIPVLMYHHIGDISLEQRDKDPIESDLTVSTADFESQVQYYHNLGFNTISVQQLYDALENNAELPARPIIFTFDDGYADVFTNAVPILEKYGYTGSFAIATELLGRPTYALWSDVIAAHNQGMEILSHTENHLDLTSKQYSEADLKREIFGSKLSLEQKLGAKVDFFVYPYGHHNQTVENLVAAAGYKMAFTTAYGTHISTGSMLSEPRVRVHGLQGLPKLKAAIAGIEHIAGQIRNNP